MAYESESFKEHHLTRLPVLNGLVNLGWDRDQIICPSEDSSDKEWRVPKTPSEATKRETGKSYQGYPVDIAIFDQVANCGRADSLQIIIECKEPSKKAGIDQLKTYLGLEPHAKLGIWTNGIIFTRVYKLAEAGEFEVVEGSGLPNPFENLIIAGRKIPTYADLKIPDSRELKAMFSDLLNVITSRDTKSTRREDQLSQVSNILLVKLDSDKEGRWEKNKNAPVAFQLFDSPARTHERLNALFQKYKNEHPILFSEEEASEIILDDDTIQEVVYRLQGFNIAEMGPSALSMAFQVFRDATLKMGDGQYYTPMPVVEAGMKLMEVTHNDIVIDPACGTGGFLSAALRNIADSSPDRAAVAQWAHYKLYGVDRDKTNIKLTRALMVGMGDGSTNAHHGDSLREAKWKTDKTGIQTVLSNDRYTVVITNPPFGKDLVLNDSDARNSGFSICRHSPAGEVSNEYAKSTELGIVFVERAWRLLQPGGRLGIVLPETYFFSKSYVYFRKWVDDHFILRGVLNVPMEAFQGFCRAKTNFYVLEKRGAKDTHLQISWYRDGLTWVSNAPTIGLNKDGVDLYQIDENGKRTGTINNKALEDVESVLNGKETTTSHYVQTKPFASSFIGVPAFSEDRYEKTLENEVDTGLVGFTTITLGELISRKFITVRNGHGSPSADLRGGTIPYIKVVDLRAGLMNPNITNMVSRTVAEQYWKGEHSGINAWDIATPSRASKNIGEPSMILPGQEDVVMTKEILVFRVSGKAPFDSFFLFWALNLQEVHDEWQRVIFMQTNREDLGDRYKYIKIPFSEDVQKNKDVSAGVREYFMRLSELRSEYDALPRKIRIK